MATAVAIVAGVLVLGAAALALWMRASAAQARRALFDPGADPGAAAVTEAQREALEAILEDRSDPLGRAERALEACRVEPEIFWRAGLRRALPLLDVGDPSDPVLAVLRATFALRLGEVAKAQEALERLPAEDWRTLRLRADLARLRGERAAEREALSRAWALAPAECKASLQASLGAWLVAGGRVEEGVEACRAATEAGPAVAEAWHQYAVALYQAGRFDEALQAGEKAVALGGGPLAIRMTEHLRRRQGQGWSPEGA